MRMILLKDHHNRVKDIEKHKSWFRYKQRIPQDNILHKDFFTDKTTWSRDIYRHMIEFSSDRKSFQGIL